MYLNQLCNMRKNKTNRRKQTKVFDINRVDDDKTSIVLHKSRMDFIRSSQPNNTKQLVSIANFSISNPSVSTVLNSIGFWS